MFTGLIREFAKVESFSGDLLKLKAKHKPKIGDSIAINGVCLTVVELNSNGFGVELSNETRSIMAIENLKNRVHMEPAMRLSDRLEGHILQGHIDCQGVIKSILKGTNSADFIISYPKEFSKFIAPKGSIAIDGVSLTLNDVSKEEFRLTIIPHTFKNTLFGEYKVNQRVNIETDMFARYIYNMINPKTKTSWEEIDSIMARF